MEVKLVQLRYHPALEDRAPQRMVPQLIRLANVEQVTQDPAVQEMKLRRLDHLFTDVGVAGWQANHEIAGFEHGQPRACSIVRDRCIRAERREIEFLRASARAQLHEVRECREIADVEGLSNVALDISRDVICELLMRGNIPVVDAWISTLPERREEIFRC